MLFLGREYFDHPAFWLFSLREKKDVIGCVICLLPFLFTERDIGGIGSVFCCLLLDSRFLRSGEGKRLVPFPFTAPILSSPVVGPPLLAPSFPFVFFVILSPLLLSAAGKGAVAVGMILVLSVRQR